MATGDIARVSALPFIHWATLAKPELRPRAIKMDVIIFTASTNS
jgi:hypothetical protein